MNKKQKKIKVSIVGCGAIGSRIAHCVKKEAKKHSWELHGIYDIDLLKAEQLAKTLNNKKLNKSSLESLLKGSDLVVEATSSNDIKNIIKKSIESKKHVLTMSVGQILNANTIFQLAKENNCSILVPSGGIAGVDAIKAASSSKLKSINLTTRKPVSGFASSEYVKKKNINLNKIKSETIIFDGNVDKAVRAFPRNINVAATIALACGNKKKVHIRILTSPKFKSNSHEIEIVGDFGKITTLTENTPCPDNPKTSYLAVLSAIQSLKEFTSTVKIGT